MSIWLLENGGPLQFKYIIKGGEKCCTLHFKTQLKLLEQSLIWPNSKEAEARNRWSALIEVKVRCFWRAHILSDALEVVRAINGHKNWSIGPILLDISFISKSFESLTFSHIHRSWVLAVVVVFEPLLVCVYCRLLFCLNEISFYRKRKNSISTEF